MVNRKDLNPESSREAAFGAHLRSSRIARGWMQEELGRRMTYSGTHISAVETGRKPPTLRFSKNADRVFELEGASESFEQRYKEIRYGVLFDGFEEYVRLEGGAVEIRLFEVGTIPGPLQTREYVTAIEAGFVRRGTATQEQADERVEYLIRRQAALERPSPPTVIAVLDESCIRQRVGGPEVMEAQLRHLVEFASRPHTILHVSPFTAGEDRPFSRLVNVLTLPDQAMVSYVESQTHGHLDRDITSVRALVRSYHQLQAGSLSQADSVELINQVRKGIL
ncbi:helix-turn-helix domain-containing protein [Streptomyces sp. NPDC057638]|uniref:helix-turn-helix domain-containing protein n=1 Tax=Streptomyces sp. NPDC057638 TaxID=3346190 RepID=UPI00368E4321